MTLIVDRIKLVKFPDNQYAREETDKNQIVLHHTVSGRGVDGDINYWLGTKSRVATHFIIDWKGDVYQCFNSKYWGYHLGMKSEHFNDHGLPYQRLDDSTLSIEIDAYGGLTKKGDKWIHEYKGVVPNKRVTEYPDGYRGYKGFESYMQKQIDTTEELLKYFCRKYSIPMDYNEDIWDVTPRALKGESGIFTHNSYRPDKSDIHPQNDIKTMLKGLKKPVDINYKTCQIELDYNTDKNKSRRK